MPSCTQIMIDTAKDYWEDEKNRGFPNNESFRADLATYVTLKGQLVPVDELEVNLNLDSLEEFSDTDAVFDGTEPFKLDDTLYYGSVIDYLTEAIPDKSSRLTADYRDVFGFTIEIELTQGDKTDNAYQFLEALIGKLSSNEDRVNMRKLWHHKLTDMYQYIASRIEIS